MLVGKDGLPWNQPVPIGKEAPRPQFLPEALPVTKEGKANHVFWVWEGDTPQTLERKGRYPVYSHLGQDTLNQWDGPLP